MFYKYILSGDYAKQIYNDKIKTVSYTEFENEPSIIHSHKHETEVIFVKSGEGSIVYPDAEVEIRPNAVYFISPNTDHTELSKNNLKYFVMHVHNFEVLDQNKISIKALEINPKDYKTLIHLLDAAITECRSAAPDTVYAASLFSTVFFTILHIVKEKTSLNISSGTPNFSSIVQSCMNYIDIYFSEISSINELCEKFNISQRNLERLFRRELKISPLGYVKKVRLEKSECLLKSSNYAVSQIAVMCGYSSFAYFSKEFKSVYGKTPSVYRQKSE